MTKEEILLKHGLQIGFKSTYSWDAILAAMDEFAQQQVKNIAAKPVLCGDSEQFYCWDEEALGSGSRCKVECDICKNKGQQ